LKLEFFPIRVGRKEGPFDLFRTIRKALEENGVSLKEGDVLIISSKFVSMSQGRLVNLGDVVYSKEAEELGKKYSIPPPLMELIMRESERLIGGVPRFVLTYKNFTLVPNAGIDRSNVKDGCAILPPKDPYEVADVIRLGFLVELGTRIGVIISDSGLLPGRRGTIGLAVGVSGIRPIKDERGKMDLFGKPLRATVRAIADELCSSAQLLMGEAGESTPIVLARGEGLWELIDEEMDEREMAVDPDICVYLRGIANGMAGEGMRRYDHL